MEKLGFGLDDSAACDPKPIDPYESWLWSIRRWFKYLRHASQCRDANCRFPNCQKLKRLIRHTESCKVKLKAGCLSCRYLLTISYQHAKLCREATCPIFKCSYFRDVLKQERLQKRAQILKRHIATMKNLRTTADVLQTKPGNSNSSNWPSPGAQPHSSPHPPQPDMGTKPSTGPPVGALQAVQPVQAAAAGQTHPHMVAASVNYGKSNPVVSPPIPSTGFMAAIQQMEAQMQMLNMGNIACWEGSGCAQNPQSHLQSMVCTPNSCPVSTSSTFPTTNSKNSK